MDEGEGELRRKQPGQGTQPGEDTDSARGAAAILVARAGEERGGAWRAQGRPRRWVGAIPGARKRFGAGARRVGGQVASAPAYGAAVGVVQGGER